MEAASSSSIFVPLQLSPRALTPRALPPLGAAGTILVAGGAPPPSAHAAWVQSPRFQESRWERTATAPLPSPHRTGTAHSIIGRGSGRTEQLVAPQPPAHAMRVPVTGRASASPLGYARTSSFTVSWNPSGSPDEFHVPSPLPKGLWKETRMAQLDATRQSRQRRREEARRREDEMQQRLRQQKAEEAQMRKDLLAKKAALEAKLAARRRAGPLIARVMRGWWSRHKLRKALEEGKYRQASLKIKGTMRKGVLNRWREATPP